MLNVKYYKDFNHNFLIINNKVSEKEQNYQYKMLSNNKLKHLLECKIRYVDEECSFYYEISSRQNLKSIFDKEEIEYGQLYHLLEHIKETLDELDHFLLDGRCLLLNPEYIFTEPETREYFFLYYPCMEETERQAALVSLAEFLVNRVTHEQEETMGIVYKIYEAVQDDKFMLPSILNMFHVSAKEPEEIITAKEDWRAEPEEIDVEAWTEEDAWEMKEDEKSNKKDGLGDHLPAIGILAFLCAAAAAGIFGIGYFFTLSMEEKLISTAVIIILIVLSAFLFLYFILNVFKRQSVKETPQGRNKVVEMGEEKRKTEYLSKKQINEYKGRDVKTASVNMGAEEYGNTVFLDISSCGKENKLYGINKGNKYHIDLNNLPCTIGKMAGSVDVVIKDSTISRIHARITRQKDGVYVTDMNSTNGTFKNGLRLDPNETVLIEQGDELRFGRMTFCYR